MSCGVACAWCVQQRNRRSTAANGRPGDGMWRRGVRPAARELQCCARLVCATVQPEEACAGQRGRWCRQRGRCIALLTSAKRHRHSRTSTSPPQRKAVTSPPQRQPVIGLHRVKRTRLPRVGQYQSAQRQPSTGPPSVTTYQSAAPRPSSSCTTSGPTPLISPHQLQR